MRNEILELLDKNNKLSAEQIAAMLGKPETAVAAEIKSMEDEQIICGYNTLINWDKTDREFVTALIEVKVTPQRDEGFDKIAKRIYMFDEVKSVFLMSGAYDLLVMLEGNNIKETAHFVSNKLSTLDSVISTSTHFVLKKYKDHGVILEKNKKGDERMIVSP